MPTKKSEAEKERQKRLRSEGKCSACGKIRDGKSTFYCDECNEKHRRRQKALVDQLRAEGRCVVCGKPRDGSSAAKCNTCLAKTRARQRRTRTTLQGTCLTCGTALPMGERGIRCQACKDRRKKNDTNRRTERLAIGICPECGKNPVRTGRNSCEQCAERAKQKQRELKIAALNEYGGPICACCGETHVEFLQIDHINGDGADHRRQIGKAGLYVWLKRHNYPPGFRVLCANCNFSMGAYGYCPHHCLEYTT